MGYLLLAGAIVLEVFGTTMMKLSHGFTEIGPTIACAAGYLLCFFLLGKSLEHINLSLAYAMWGGIGIILTVGVAYFLFGEQITLPVMIGIVMIIAGVVVVNMFSNAH